MYARVPYWVRDEEASDCSVCSRSLGVLRRRHHCRRCGRILCDDCSPHLLLVPLDELVKPPDDVRVSLAPFDPREPQRVCLPCEAGLRPRQAELQATMAHAALETAVDRSSLERYLNSPITINLRDEIAKATHTLHNFTSDNAIEGADSIPRDLIAEARGLAFITMVKAGFFFSGRVGTGLVIARSADGGWSAPSALGCGGVGWGFQLGGEVTDLVVVLASNDAVEAFAGKGQVSIGTELSVSLGPLGRTAATDIRAGGGTVAAAFSYAHSRGVFLGVSLECATIMARPDANRDFYGREVTSRELLSGAIPPPRAAAPLYRALAEVEGRYGASFGGGGGGGMYEGTYNGGYDFAAARATSNGAEPEVQQAWARAFSPFDPHAEASARVYPLDSEDVKQMRQDHEMAMALQRQEYEEATRERSARFRRAVAGGGGGGGGGGGSASSDGKSGDVSEAFPNGAVPATPTAAATPASNGSVGLPAKRSFFDRVFGPDSPERQAAAGGAGGLANGKEHGKEATGASGEDWGQELGQLRQQVSTRNAGDSTSRSVDAGQLHGEGPAAFVYEKYTAADGQESSEEEDDDAYAQEIARFATRQR